MRQALANPSGFATNFDFSDSTAGLAMTSATASGAS